MIRKFLAISTAFLLVGASLSSHACDHSHDNELVKAASRLLSENESRRAYVYLNLAREQDLAEGFKFTAGMYEFGIGVKADPAMASRLFKRGADLGDMESMYKTARRFYEQGLSLEGDLWAKRAEVCGSTQALLLLMDRAISFGQGPDALMYIEKGIDKGLTPAKFALAEAYDKGAFGLPKDLNQAFKWYYIAAKEGDAKAMSAVAFYFFRGQHRVQDELAAVHWYHEAAKAGHVDSMTAYAWMLQNGRGGQADASEATRYFKRAAALGDANAVAFLRSSRTQTAAGR